jgi:hypothetical protein
MKSLRTLRHLQFVAGGLPEGEGKSQGKGKIKILSQFFSNRASTPFHCNNGNNRSYKVTYLQWRKGSRRNGSELVQYQETYCKYSTSNIRHGTKTWYHRHNNLEFLTTPHKTSPLEGHETGMIQKLQRPDYYDTKLWNITKHQQNEGKNSIRRRVKLQ